MYETYFHWKPLVYVDTRTESPSSRPHRNTLAQLKDAYTKLFEDYNELKEEKKKREVH